MLAISSWALFKFELFMQPTTIAFPVATRAVKLAYLAIPVWGFAMTCIKISAILTLLRIPINHRYWRPNLYAITTLQIACLVGSTIFTFVACIPLEAVWDFTAAPTAHCLGMEAPRIASNIGSGINISTDLLLSLAPIFFLSKTRRPLRERILVCAAAGIGLLASMSSFVKAILVRKWGDPDVDLWALAISIATWTILEQFLAVMAVCSPSLNGRLQQALKSTGILLAHCNSRVDFLGGRTSRLAAALMADQRDVVGNTGLRAPSPARFGPGEAIKTYFTLSRSTGRSLSDLESGSGGGSRGASELNIWSSVDGREDGVAGREAAPGLASPSI
jgi:hypothetical protein